MILKMSPTFFKGLPLRHWVSGDRCFETTYRCHLQESKVLEEWKIIWDQCVVSKRRAPFTQRRGA